MEKMGIEQWHMHASSNMKVDSADKTTKNHKVDIPNSNGEQGKSIPQIEERPFVYEKMKFSFEAMERTMAEKIIFLPENERAQFILDILEDTSVDPNADIRLIAFQLIKFVPENERASIVLKGLKDTHRVLSVRALQNIHYLPIDQRAPFVVQYLEKANDYWE